MTTTFHFAKPQQSTEPVVTRSLSSASGKHQLNRQKRIKRNKCQQCDKSFNRSFDLKQHQLVHTGIRTYQFPRCSKSFGLKGDEGKCLLLFIECRFCDQLLFLVRQVPYNPYKTDIFATGVSLFLMLSEKYLLQRTTDREVILA